MSARRHDLAEHHQAVKDWWRESIGWGRSWNPDGMVPVSWLMIAYERWLNDRPLLTDEAGPS